MFLEELYKTDPEIFDAIYKETCRQHEGLELIASENFTSLAVLAALGSPLTNKYAEGYPGKRYYGGCQFVDIAEELARKRLTELFGADWANVQPHSGTQANMSVYFAVMNPGDTLLSMELSHGGHLSHGHPVNFTGKWYKVASYRVNPDDERLHMDEVRKVALETRPKVIVCGYSNYPRTIDFKAFREIADEVGAYLLADIAHIAGLVAAGEHPSPIPYAHFVSTTTHKTLRGPRGGAVMAQKDVAEILDKSVFPGMQGGPLMHVIAAKAVAFKEAMSPDFKEYQSQIIKNAKALAETLAAEGLRLVSGGTDNHLMSVDLRPQGLTGKEVEEFLGKADITVNKNTIPYDPQKPWITSGIRIGVPAVTTRGMKEPEMRVIGKLLARAITSKGDPVVLEEVKKEVRELTAAFPLYKALREKMLAIAS
jgi:glycine hydroxymethyltransferase